MGRALNKKYFGNTNSGGLVGEGVASVTVGGTNNAYVTVATLTFAAPTLPGGVTATGTAVMKVSTAVRGAGAGTGYTDGDIVTLVGGTFTEPATFTVAETGGIVDTLTLLSAGKYTVLPAVDEAATTGGTGTGVTVDLTFMIDSITITQAGSGYTTAPVITEAGNADLTAVLTTTGANGIIAYAYTAGASKIADIVKQVSTRQYKIKTADSTIADDRAVLTAAAPTAVGEMNIIGTDAASGTYYVTKLTNHRATVIQDTGNVWADGESVAWTFGTADANTIKIENA